MRSDRGRPLGRTPLNAPWTTRMMRSVCPGCGGKAMPGLRKRPYLDESDRLSIHELVRAGLLNGKRGTNLYLRVTIPSGTQTVALTPLPTGVPGRPVGTSWYFICGE